MQTPAKPLKREPTIGLFSGPPERMSDMIVLIVTTNTDRLRTQRHNTKQVATPNV